MKMSLQVRLLGTIVGAMLLFFIISVVAARFTLQKDLEARGAAEVSDGANAFAGYWDAHRDQIRLLVAQDAGVASLRQSLQSGNTKTLADQLSTLASTSGMSFLVLTDARGRVLARAHGAPGTSMTSNSFITRALGGETISTAAVLPAAELRAEGLSDQADSSVTDASGKVVERADRGLALVAAAPVTDAVQHTIGALYGGVLLNHFYDLVDQSTRALGGSTGLLEGDALVASTILAPDGTRVIDRRLPIAAQVRADRSYAGTDAVGGTRYLVHVDPILDDQNNLVGERWYGVPLQQFTDIINHTTQALILWGLVAFVIALGLAIPIVQRLANALARRSHQVRDAAKDLGVAIVGSEVSGDHVAATRAAVEKSGSLIDQLAAAPGANGVVGQLKSLNEELHGDIIVIDTLSQEMSSRMQQAVTRVKELNDVAGGLNKLVTGEAN